MKVDLLDLEKMSGALPDGFDGVDGVLRIDNLGNGEGFSVREVVEAASAVTGRQIEAIISATWEWMQSHPHG